MDSLDRDIASLEDAMRLFIQTMKRPQRWEAIRTHAGVDFDRPSSVILQALRHDPRARWRVQDLAFHMGIEPPYITRKTQELEHAGHIRRVPDPRDRRAVDLQLTPLGRKSADRLHKAQGRMLTEALKRWKPEDRRRFIELFERFSRDIASSMDTDIRKTKGE
jgi:DNA-binding MarR family transcriptional regulator